MSGCIRVSDPLVDELIEFHADAPGVARGYALAQCTACDAYTAGAESYVEDWARDHVDSRHRGGRHTAWLRAHEPLVCDTSDRGGRHRALRNHAFVQHRDDDRFGCGRPEDDEPTVRCGYYRHHHPTMAAAR